ncbi:unnamed protein product [Moneuplotes crassus]|uniref:t-SNARE coiled-coil homology domain-containing protein n=1 Tax=Euplotes crassus TaxID=5936 RepID=A0AAD1XCK0_EUPCR|nr:unnamed protein product [Moneuplotes crassus]
MSFEDYGGEKEGLKGLREPLIQEVDMQQIFRRIKLELGKVKELNQSAKQVLDAYEANQGVDGRKGRQKLEQIFNQKSDEEISDFEHLLKGLKEAEEYIKEMEGKCKEDKLNKLKEMDRTYRHQAETLAKEYENLYNRFLSQKAKQEIPKADIRSKMYQRTNYDDENPDPIRHSQKDQAVSILTAEERKTRVEAEIIKKMVNERREGISQASNIMKNIKSVIEQFHEEVFHQDEKLGFVDQDVDVANTNAREGVTELEDFANRTQRNVVKAIICLAILIIILIVLLYLIFQPDIF